MTYLAQIVLFNDNGLPEDSSVNTWHFEIDDSVVSGDVEDVILNGGDGPGGPNVGIHPALEQFYDSVGGYLSTLLTGTGEAKYYDLDDPTPRAPILVEPFDFGTTGTGALPTEVALCISFQAVKVSGVSQASRRNRFYLGPLSTTAAATSTSRPDATATATMDSAITAFYNTADGAPAWSWVVYSPKLGSSADVDNGWIDNAFDTQRRRGLAPTTRVTFP